jgi:hypothetical protein
MSRLCDAEKPYRSAEQVGLLGAGHALSDEEECHQGTVSRKAAI